MFANVNDADLIENEPNLQKVYMNLYCHICIYAIFQTYAHTHTVYVYIYIYLNLHSDTHADTYACAYTVHIIYIYIQHLMSNVQ